MQLDGATVLGIVTIINAVGGAIALIITTWFSSKRAALHVDERLPPTAQLTAPEPPSGPEP